jgi:two-component system chemotaxis response regulator CheB
LTVVQDPLDALAPDMPRAALHAVEVDHVTNASGLAALLASLIREEAPLGRGASPEMRLEVEIAMGESLGVERLMTIATPSPFSCPQCDGVLSELMGDGPLRYRCQIGHAVTGEVPDDCQELDLERAMGVALRVLQERIAPVKRLADDTRIQGNPASAERHDVRAGDYAEQAQILRRAMLATLAQRARTQE